jgi:outer membrane protein assembly factor BamB
VVALDIGTGAELWRTDYASPTEATASFGETAAARGRLFFGAGSEVLAVDVADGAVVWRTDMGPGWEHRAIGWGVSVTGDTVYASIERFLSRTGHIGRGYLVALDAATGEILWTFTDSDGVGPRQFRTPHVGGGLVLVGDNMNNTYIAVDRWTGEELWRVIGERGWSGPSKSPVVSNDTVFGGSGDRWAKAMDLYTGEVIWETHFGGSLARGVELCGSRVLTWDTPLRVLDRATGELLESLDLYGEYGSLIQSITVDPETKQAYVLGTKHLFVFRCPS